MGIEDSYQLVLEIAVLSLLSLHKPIASLTLKSHMMMCERQMTACTLLVYFFVNSLRNSFNTSRIPLSPLIPLFVSLL